MQIILASVSLGRKKILKSLGLKFKVIPSKIDETKITASNPKLLVQKTARAKAEKVFERTKNQLHSNPVKLRHGAGVVTQQLSYLIIAADSMIVLDGKTIGKPKDRKEAKEILKQLSGKTHSFITGLYVINTKTNKTWQKLAESKVTFKKLKDKEINAYIAKTDVTHYAGGYAIVPPGDFNLQTIKQGQSKIITKVKGSLTNVMGLPVEALLPILRKSKILT